MGCPKFAGALGKFREKNVKSLLAKMISSRKLSGFPSKRFIKI